ncbi:hypothetical protein N7474_007548 [Penicillium riverlandense]|uniref:uncharacterized protein n=1 Tax=Penicillium riverlandense TaxID=1903569 RepID=UPI002549252B|nr:uncharacterized protein N7474_007548 [Penicillium riverlandense]KAJ5815771.1 hypothetical protein N7474_007548 [Penicillium riverlandense]
MAATEPIAIVGSACRFPGDATSPSKLWDLLKDPRDVLTEIPESRFNTKAFYHPDGLHHGTTNVRHSYVLTEDHRLFDAQFFGTKPVEANSIDPQQRLLLETVYECLESAGIPMERLQGSDTGVYVGLMTNDYADLLGRDVQSLPTYFASGTARSILSNRISYFFDWHGPSMTIDTACSSSLIALHQAVQSLRSGESSVAVAAGTNLLLGPEQYVAESKLKMLSPNGRSRMWDKDADGYARGDGIAAVILKTLSAALADGDHIECLIRETGTNQDGRTKGITMPNPVAQADLIRTTYARAGLDLSKPSDRPQYFEAHGTGTPAGDPVEAEAISTAFFGPSANYYRRSGQELPLYVGSIKTVIGHTEGTAGLAAVLKASLALQCGIIPPNLLLNELSPTVRPFYNDLEILKSAQDWPELPSGVPRRASVNSFGFGGANAHAILETFDSNMSLNAMPCPEAVNMLPFNFSAASEKSLLSTLSSYSEYLKMNQGVNLRDLSWTLTCRRSTLPVRFSVSASSVEDLEARLDKATQSSSEISTGAQISSVHKLKLLGIFTGQGAQWARMGAELLVSSPMAVDCVSRLEKSLQQLPKEHRPSWSLKEELLKDAASSQIGKGEFSQPLCTAIQIVLVELLRAANIQFHTVVGHSSGEIAAAFAANYISAEDAIRIAYYRGWSLQYSGAHNGVQGAMMVAGTSFEDAKELCEMPTLDKRICVACSNSSTSVTLSGDADAIDEAIEIFQDEKKFNRRLKVDKAYHSHHMMPCSDPYVEAVRKCGVHIQSRPSDSATWISSVYVDDIENVRDNLVDTYWSNNMVNPVLFSQAISYAVGAAGPFDMALEIGPHPALQGPVKETVQEISGNTIPYSGTLSRNKNDREVFTSSLGSLWATLGENAVDFSSFDRRAGGVGDPPKLMKGLPSYCWDHDRVYWHESRLSTTFRATQEEFHHLLGIRCSDGTIDQLRWRNYLNPREIPWLADHQVQGQMVFPAAGYISAAVECILRQYALETVQLMDFHDVIIRQALVLEENTGVETIFDLKIIERRSDRVKATFSCYSAANRTFSSLALHASAQIQIVFGKPRQDVLPPRKGTYDRFLDLESDRFYQSVSNIGFSYTGPFQALSDLSRKMDEATGLVAVPTGDQSERPLLIHPASLDGAIQSIMLAYCFPGDGRLRTIYLPTKIDCVRINPSGWVEFGGPGASLPFHSIVGSAKFSELSGDVNLFSADGATILQLQGLHTTPLTPPTAASDVQLFTEITWGNEIPKVSAFDSDRDWFQENFTLALDLERLAHFHLKNLDLSITPTERSGATWHHVHMLSNVKHCLSLVKSGQHPFAKSQWANDTKEDADRILSRYEPGHSSKYCDLRPDRNSYPDSIDVKIIHAVGENFPSVIRGEKNIMDVLTEENMLNEFYANTLGIHHYLKEMARMAGQISYRYPHMSVLEIGAGAGATTDLILKEMNTAFSSYTYTDISNALFDDAQERFSDRLSKMTFRVLDIEKDVIEQGYAEESFDLIIASLALHATKQLEAALSNVRRLLKPGGYLLLLELTNPDVMHFGLVLGGLPGWWMGYDEGRQNSPLVSIETWEGLMRKAGFSGIDAISPQHPKSPIPFSVIATQAVDNRVHFVREPLALEHRALGLESLTIIGGKTSQTSVIVEDIKAAVARHYNHIRDVPSLIDLISSDLPFMGTVVSLIELDEPMFKSMSSEKVNSFKELFKQSKNIIWVTYGAQGDNPYANMFTGVQRTLVSEMDHLHIQRLNFHSLIEANGRLIAQKLLLLEIAGTWNQNGERGRLLWYDEPELDFRDGNFLVPRFRLNQTRNDRYNSSRRSIVKEINRDTSLVSIRWSRTGYRIDENNIRNTVSYPDRTEITVTHSLLRAVKITDDASVFLVFGTNPQTGEHVIGASESLNSLVHVPPTWVVRCGPSVEYGIQSTISLYIHFLATAMLDQVPPGKSLVVLDPDFSFASILTQRASEKGIQLVFLTTADDACMWPWVYIHPCATKREILENLPLDIARFVNIGGDQESMSIIKQCLPVNCDVQTEQSLTSEISSSESYGATSKVAAQIQATWMRIQNEPAPVNLLRFGRLYLHELIQNVNPPTSQFIVEWGDSKLPAQVQPASVQVRFSSDKTYWLVGLTGGLGLSLCQWMARQGARYIALSSRNPKVDEVWLRQMAARGCTIRVFSSDITDRGSVRATHRHICGTMPPIAGVAQGAMVLQDTMFPDLDLARLERVLRPKVDGSILLDELFSENTLEFMIFFSSMAAATGNPGQVAYNAANMFMASLAAQRKKRGLAAYAINIGAVVGNGYVTRELNMSQQNYLYRVGHSWMSEQDFHEVFAEGVLSCTDPSGAAELCSGLRIDDDESKSWVSNPMFQHLVFRSSNLLAGGKKGKAGIIIKAQLLEAVSCQEVIRILEDGFVLKLQTALQADPDKPMLDMSPDELGIDSLVAVDLRSWFLKELAVDMPVLKIFNAVSIRELLASAAELLSDALIPNVGDGARSFENSQLDDLNALDVYNEGPESANETSADEAGSLTVEMMESLKLRHLDSANAYSGSSTASLRAGDSNSEETEDPASSIYTDDYGPVVPNRIVQKKLLMSFGQSRFWFLNFFVEDKSAFNSTTTIRLTGRLQIDAFAKALESVGEHHEALRTFFFTDGEKRNMQGIWATSILRLEHGKIIDENEVDKAARQMKAHVFDLEQGDILRVQLLSLSPEQHWIIFGCHHINMDGVSFENFWSDVEKAYQGFPLSSTVLQYPDFTLRQLYEYETGVWADDLDFWRRQFVELPPPIPLLPFSRLQVRPSVSQFRSHTALIRLEESLCAKVDQCCRVFKTTPFHFYLAIWKILVLGYLDIDSVCIGVGDANRTDSDVLNSIGFFLNILPVQFMRKPNQSFGEALKDIRYVAQNAFAHSRVPFDVILNVLYVTRSASYSPLFQIFFNYRRKIQESRMFCGCRAEGELLGAGETAYDLSLDVVDVSNGETSLCLSVRKDLYEMEHADILVRSYCTLLRSFVENPATRVSWPSLYSKEDVELAVSLGRGMEMKNQWPATIVHRVDEIARLYGSRAALKDQQNHVLTYSQMQNRVTIIANELLDNGVGPGTPVGIFQSPNIDWICSLLAILRVGGAYIPLDKKVGMNRLTVITNDSRLRVILVDSSTSSEFSLLKSEADPIDVSILRGAAVSPVPVIAEPEGTAVIMYTSGSTGTPKAIRIQHLAWVHKIQGAIGEWRLAEGEETILQQSSYSFDMSLAQIFISLCTAGTLLIASNLTRSDPVAISDLIASENVTVTVGTPAEYLGWLQHGRLVLRYSQLRTTISGGEALSNGLIQQFQLLDKPDLRLINAYGPTEATLACSSAEVPYTQLDATSAMNNLPLSTSPNYSVYIIDGRFNPVPIGIPGEVVIGGPCVSQGYLNEIDTKARFLQDRHASTFFRDHGWTTVHRTGDRGKLCKDGSLIIMGRIEGDTQVKFGGIRMDLEDIETTIVRAAGGKIVQAVVSVRTQPDLEQSKKFQVAFVVLCDDNPPSQPTQFLKNLLAELPMPQYMRPAALIRVDHIPLTPSGKIDRLAINGLPIPQATHQQAHDTELTPSETSLRHLWQEVLPQGLVKHFSIGATSDFFHVGGSSLALVNLQGLIKDRLGVSVPLYQLFDASALHAMAARIGNLSSPISNLTVDWEDEVQISSDVDQTTLSFGAAATPPLGINIVVLTGSTGFLGKEILQQLIDDDRIMLIHCIAVRKDRSQLPEIFSDDKVIVHQGDLGASQLGLNDPDAISVFSHADIIIHNGADVSFMKSYHTLKLINVASTKELVKLALPRRVPFHFISSASVARLAHKDSFGEISVAQYPPPQVPDDGYIAAKWVSEVYLERVSRQFGLPVWIHRPSSVTGPEAPELDLMSNLMRYIHETKAIPDSRSWSGMFDFISVQSAASQIIKSVDSSTAIQPLSGDVKYIYVSGEMQIGQEEVQSLMELGTGGAFEVIPVNSWAERAEKAGMNALLGVYLRRVSDGQVLLPRLIKYSEGTG